MRPQIQITGCGLPLTPTGGFGLNRLLHIISQSVEWPVSDFWDWLHHTFKFTTSYLLTQCQSYLNLGFHNMYLISWWWLTDLHASGLRHDVCSLQTIWKSHTTRYLSSMLSVFIIDLAKNLHICSGMVLSKTTDINNANMSMIQRKLFRYKLEYPFQTIILHFCSKGIYILLAFVN